MQKHKVGILGATGMVGQKFISLLDKHPFFEIVVVAASPRSAGKLYQEAVEGRWTQKKDTPKNIKKLVVKDVSNIDEIANEVSVVFSALDMDKKDIRFLEEEYASRGIGVISNNSAHRWTNDVPMILPEVNPEHSKLIEIQRANRGWKKGFIAVKPNCSIQSYVPAIEALQEFEPKQIIVTTFQAISGAGKTFETWPEIIDNVIPFIGGEEEKSEKEPLKIWGEIKKDRLELVNSPIISANCVRVAAADGHMAEVNVKFNKEVTRDQIINNWENFKNPIMKYELPSAPNPFMRYLEKEDRPQTSLDRDYQNGMGVTIGRLRKDNIFDWKFACLSHNTVRGAAGGAILMAELLFKQGYMNNSNKQSKKAI